MKEKLSKQEAETFFAYLYDGLHHLPNPIKEFGDGYAVASPWGMATFDSGMLTRLVIMAHDMCYRAEMITNEQAQELYKAIQDKYPIDVVSAILR
jgi:hypothetical protein